jgi:hypothetical protein
MTTLRLTDAELDELCPGLTQQAARLRHLREQGFVRARLVHGRIVLERAHYEAVCRGEFAAAGRPDYDGPRIKSLVRAA